MKNGFICYYLSLDVGHIYVVKFPKEVVAMYSSTHKKMTTKLLICKWWQRKICYI